MADRDRGSFEASPLGPLPLRDLGLTIEGSPLAPILTEFSAELERSGIHKVKPRFYLSTEWGVPEGTVAVAIPFYLAREDLTALHAERVGHVEGVGRLDILRYLRHEMGHVVNYAYRLFETKEWIATFGPMSRPYREEFRLEPFSRRFVRHLPGWYAQKHPDEDWAETFAVWMTPDLDWRADYADAPEALRKLHHCDRTMADLADRDPIVDADDLDGDIGELSVSIDEFYAEGSQPESSTFPVGLDSALRSVFEHDDRPDRVAASALIAGLERTLMASVYHWTGHFPERTRTLLRYLAAKADAMALSYARSEETRKTAELTALVTALAMNHVERGAYLA